MLLALSSHAADKKAPAAPKSGVKTPGVQIPFANLKSDADITLPGAAGAFVITDAVYVPVRSKDSLIKIDGKSNKPADPIAGFKGPCSGAVSAFDSLWIPNCGDGTLARFDPKAGKLSATVASGSGDVRAGIASDPDSIWLFTDNRTTLTRVDPKENRIVSELRLPAGCHSMTFAETALWCSCPEENRLLRIDPRTNLVVNRIEVAAAPTALASGEGSIWVYAKKDGKLDRVDPKTNKVSKTIDLGIPGADGDIAVGEGSVWVSAPGFPITRVDPKSEKVAQQFWGEGGGLIRTGLGSVWLANASSVRRFDPKRVTATLAE